MIHIVIIDDDVEMGKSLVRWLKTKSEEVMLEGFFTSTKELIGQKENLSGWDILLLDIELEEENGISQIQNLKSHFPDIQIIIFSSHVSEEYVLSALRAGASSYSLKGSGLDSLWASISQTYLQGAFLDPKVTQKVTQFFSSQNGDDDPRLTNREIQVVMGFVDGLSYKMIASRLGVTVHTINHFVRLIYKKLGVNSKSELVRMAYRGEISGISI